MSDDTDDLGRIERDLDRTRSRLGGHLDQLQDRLSPGQVLDDLMGYFRGSEGAAFGQNLVESVKSNPLPAALTGIGLAWLMAANPRGGTTAAYQGASDSGRVRIYGSPAGSGGETYDAMMDRLRLAEQGVTRRAGEAEDAFSERLSDARGKVVGLTRDAAETAEAYGARVQEALGSARQGMADAAQRVKDSVTDGVSGAVTAAGNALSSVANSVGSGASQASRAVGQTGSNAFAAITDSPVLLGVLGLAAGALLGALIPQSEQEEQALGGIAGQARRTAEDLAKDGMERGTQVAQAVLEKGRESAEAHGLTGGKSAGELVDAALSGKLASDVKDMAAETMGKAEEAVRAEAGKIDPKPSPSKPG